MRQIPNLFTLFNLFLGVLAIIFILQTNENIVLLGDGGFTQINLPEKLTWGSLCIFGAAVIDFLDGFVARIFKATSKLGEQLDSLADLVSFGVAPGLIMYQLLRLSFAQQEDGLDVSIIWLLPALLIPCAAAWRLAKFNIDEQQVHSFKGIPTPASGLLIASFPLILFYQTFNLQIYLINTWVLYAIIFLLSYLMISNLSFMSLKFRDFTFKNNVGQIILILVAFVSAFILKWAAIPAVFLMYVILSLLAKNKIA